MVSSMKRHNRTSSLHYRDKNSFLQSGKLREDEIDVSISIVNQIPYSKRLSM